MELFTLQTAQATLPRICKDVAGSDAHGATASYSESKMPDFRLQRFKIRHKHFKASGLKFNGRNGNLVGSRLEVKGRTALGLWVAAHHTAHSSTNLIARLSNAKIRINIEAELPRALSPMSEDETKLLVEAKFRFGGDFGDRLGVVDLMAARAVIGKSVAEARGLSMSLSRAIGLRLSS